MSIQCKRSILNITKSQNYETFSSETFRKKNLCRSVPTHNIAINKIKTIFQTERYANIYWTLTTNSNGYQVAKNCWMLEISVFHLNGNQNKIDPVYRSNPALGRNLSQ